jgi:hypothetical protein
MGRLQNNRNQLVMAGYLAHRKLTVLAGVPDVGKTTIALDICARLTSGQPFPDGTPCKARDVFFWSGEDTIEDTLLPRFKAMGGDPARVHCISAVTYDENNQKKTRAFDPAQDMPGITSLLKALPEPPALVNIDPIVLVTKGDSHKNSEVRRDLLPLQELMQQTGAGILGITHFTKGTQGKSAIERVTGSLAFAAVPRLVIVAGWRTRTGPHDPLGNRWLASLKHNISAPVDSHTYNLRDALIPDDDVGSIGCSVVNWQGKTTQQAQELLDEAELSRAGKKRNDQLKDAIDMLCSMLKDGPKLADEIEAERKRCSIGIRARDKAVEILQVVKARQSTARDAPWQWSLPNQKAAKQTEEDMPF